MAVCGFDNFFFLFLLGLNIIFILYSQKFILVFFFSSLVNFSVYVFRTSICVYFNPFIFILFNHDFNIILYC